jgi:hypothetical protein
MSEETQVLADSQNAEALNAAAVAAEAAQKAQAAQMEAALESAMTKFFARGVEEKRFVDVGRIPFICDDLRGIHGILNDINLIIKLSASVLALVFLPIMGWLLLQSIHSAAAIDVLQHATH